MLGEERCDAGVTHQRFDELHDRAAIARCGSRRRLVHEQQSRRAFSLSERDREFDAFDIGVGKRCANLLGKRACADTGEERVGLGATCGGEAVRKHHVLSAAGKERELNIFARGHRCKGGRCLECAAHAGHGYALRRQPVDTFARKPHRTGVGLELSVDDVEARRLAGAVGADQRHQLSRADAE